MDFDYITSALFFDNVIVVDCLELKSVLFLGQKITLHNNLIIPNCQILKMYTKSYETILINCILIINSYSCIKTKQ